MATAVAAPAFATSPCFNKSALQTVTWAASPGTETSGGSTYNTQSGVTANATTVRVTGLYTATATGGGSRGASNFNSALTQTAFLVTNNTPFGSGSTAPDPAANYQTVTFSFSRPVFALSFFMDDIDRGTTPSFFDQVAVGTAPAETPTAARGAAITGSGILGDPWRTTGGSGDNDASQTVGLTYANGTIGITTLQMRFWSTDLPPSASFQLIRIRSMQFRTCGT